MPCGRKYERFLFKPLYLFYFPDKIGLFEMDLYKKSCALGRNRITASFMIFYTNYKSVHLVTKNRKYYKLRITEVVISRLKIQKP